MPHSIHILEPNIQRGFEPAPYKIGIAIPCHKNDLKYMKKCLTAVARLNPYPYAISVNVNWDSSLREARKRLFKELFYVAGCKIILQTSVDFYLFPQILKYVKRNRVVTFAPLARARYDLPLSLIRFFHPMRWTGCYSIPIEYWEKCKEKFDGYDSSIRQQIGRFNYDAPRKFLYYSLRPYKKDSMQQSLKNRPLWKKIVWRLVRLGI